ncbi:bifunctional pyr operon transcriptional regulator/uracil phosphoribosyltransferase PyrR [Lentisphaerota bacterium WC36G]|nr:bifunctional pyr operon transcriptional regulator/uracil phosphoribosyltransferase PyrR [Lentisphaerae bacterium WC36]
MSSEKIILNRQELAEIVNKIADQILEEFYNNGNRFADVVFVGIQRRGVPFVTKLRQAILDKVNIELPLAKLDITMYRDDIHSHKNGLPVINETKIPFDVNDKIVILADDVLHSGRTIRAALDAITDYGRPKVIRLATVINRGGREFPICADYVGLVHQADPQNHIKVKWDSIDSKEEVIEVVFD